MIFLLLFLLFPQAVFAQGYGQLNRPGVQAMEGGSLIGHAMTVNCDGSCILCTLTGQTLNISFNPSCGGGGSLDLLLESGQYLLLEDGTKIIL